MSKILLALSWGHKYPLPGESNIAVAKAIQKVAGEYRFVVTQIEITNALKEFSMTPDCSVGEPGTYIDTYDVVKKMKLWLVERNVDLSRDSFVMVCHKTHWRGLYLVCKKLGLKNVTRLEVDIPYDPNSYQWYTRGPIGALVGKITHGISYFLKGHLI